MSAQLSKLGESSASLSVEIEMGEMLQPLASLQDKRVRCIQSNVKTFERSLQEKDPDLFKQVKEIQVCSNGLVA